MQAPTSFLGKRYKDENGYMLVIGYIDRPAIILKNPITHKTETIVIGSGRHGEMTEITSDDALGYAESALFFQEDKNVSK